MLKSSANQIISGLTKEGFRFREFTLESEGIYAIDDADWNYKDIPHLEHIHHLVEAVPTVVGDDLIASVLVQRVMGLRIPLCLVSYESSQSPLIQTYYVSWLWFVLIIETRYQAVGVNRTRVITTYNVGGPRLLQWTFPIIRYLLSKNYKVLMSVDIPMRERRGYLRSLGIGFKKDAPTYGFRETLKIHSTRVIPPRAASDIPRHTIRIGEMVSDGSVMLVGISDHLGLQLHRAGNEIRVFPRLCSHEGGCLDTNAVNGDHIKCPWHGRKYQPCLRIDTTKPSGPQIYEDELRRIVYDSGVIAVYDSAGGTRF